MVAGVTVSQEVKRSPMQPMGALAPTGPVGLTCPWCKQYWPARPQGNECANCGGALPALPGMERAMAPPPGPRHLPEKYTRDLLLWKNVGAVVGSAFAAFGALFGVIGLGLFLVLLPLGLGFLAFGLLFGGIGWVIRNGSRREGMRQIAALTHGYAAEGQIVTVNEDRSEYINGRHPYRIDYVFQVNGQMVGGSTKGWDVIHSLRRPGEPLWVVYLPNDPSSNSIWPPIS